jgi:hypothetical protein
MDRRFDFASHGIAGFDRGPGINKAFDLDYKRPPHPPGAGVSVFDSRYRRGGALASRGHVGFHSVDQVAEKFPGDLEAHVADKAGHQQSGGGVGPTKAGPHTDEAK